MDLIEELCKTYGPAGREHRIREILERELKNSRFDMRTDRLGNLIVHRPGKSERAQKIMLCAHMDEIGLIVTYIDKKGFLRFTNVGGVFSEHILYQRVIFENGTTGIIGVEPSKDESKEGSKSGAKPKFERMFIDIGAHAGRRRRIVGGAAVAIAVARDQLAFARQVVGTAWREREWNERY